MLKYSWLQMILMLQSMQFDGSLWMGLITIIAKRFYGSRQCTHMPWVILFLQKLIPRKKLWEASYRSKRVHPGGCQGCPAAEEVYPKKTCNIDGTSKTTVHFWIVASTICVHCNLLKPVLTEENIVARLSMALEFRDPVDLTKYCDMLDQIHLDEKWFFLT